MAAARATSKAADNRRPQEFIGRPQTVPETASHSKGNQSKVGDYRGRKSQEMTGHHRGNQQPGWKGQAGDHRKQQETT